MADFKNPYRQTGVSRGKGAGPSLRKRRGLGGGLPPVWQGALWAAGAMVMLLFGLVAGFFIWAPKVVDQFDQVLAHSAENTIILDKDGRLLTTVQGDEDRQTIAIREVNPQLLKAVVAIEDRRFFSHKGMDPMRVAGAVWADLKAKSYQQGASTITQQLVKVTLLSPEPSLKRKAKEVLMAMALESTYSKRKILEFYLNQVYFGYGLYGVEKASRSYFHKPASQLETHEAAFLASLIKKPEGYIVEGQWRKEQPDRLVFSPGSRLVRRQQEVLATLLELGWISEEDYRQAQEKPLVVYKPEPTLQAAPYFVSQVMKEVRLLLEVNRVNGRGFRVETTVDPEAQAMAEKLISHLAETKPGVQGALVAMEPQNGFVRALVGGVDYSASEFNRATQAQRQTGSAIKPLLYAAAFENGYKVNSVFVDQPNRYEWHRTDGTLEIYEPHNYNEHYGVVREEAQTVLPIHYEMTLAKALERSSNVISVKLLDRLGQSRLVRLTDRVGVPIRVRNGLCNALGCSEATPLQLTAAYAPFANGGFYHPPVLVRRITNSDGEVLFEHNPASPERVLSPWTAFQMNKLLQAVVDKGTGQAANLNRPVGGKTGTNEGPRDTWFIGFTSGMLTGVWMGTDDNQNMPGEAGGTTTARLWREFMSKTLPPPAPGEAFPEPEEPYVAVRTCVQSGEVAGEWCPVTAVYHYRRGDAPTQVCQLHQGPLTYHTIDLESGELATPYCPVANRARKAFYANHAPTRYCSLHAPAGWQQAPAGQPVTPQPQPPMANPPPAAPAQGGVTKPPPTAAGDWINPPEQAAPQQAQEL